MSTGDDRPLPRSDTLSETLTSILIQSGELGAFPSHQLETINRLVAKAKEQLAALADGTSWEEAEFRTALVEAGVKMATPPASAEPWESLDTILLDYVNRPFGQAEAIECRERIRAAASFATPPASAERFVPPLPAEAAWAGGFAAGRKASAERDAVVVLVLSEHAFADAGRKDGWVVGWCSCDAWPSLTHDKPGKYLDWQTHWVDALRAAEAQRDDGREGA